MNEISEPKDGGTGGCLKALGVGCLVVALLAVAAGLYVAANWKTWAGNAARDGFNATIDGSSISEVQKTRIKAQVERLTEDFATDKIALSDLTDLFTALGPVMEVGIATVAVEAYLKDSGLDPAEKAEGELTLKRFIRGAFNDKIPDDELQQVVDIISVEGPSRGQNLKKTLTDSELREAIALAKKFADEAAIPLDVPDPDIADEFEAAVQKFYDSLGTSTVEDGTVEDGTVEESTEEQNK